MGWGGTQVGDVTQTHGGVEWHVLGVCHAGMQGIGMRPLGMVQRAATVWGAPASCGHGTWGAALRCSAKYVGRWGAWLCGGVACRRGA